MRFPFLLKCLAVLLALTAPTLWAGGSPLGADDANGKPASEIFLLAAGFDSGPEGPKSQIASRIFSNGVESRGAGSDPVNRWDPSGLIWKQLEPGAWEWEPNPGEELIPTTASDGLPVNMPEGFLEGTRYGAGVLVDGKFVIAETEIFKRLVASRSADARSAALTARARANAQAKYERLVQDTLVANAKIDAINSARIAEATEKNNATKRWGMAYGLDVSPGGVSGWRSMLLDPLRSGLHTAYENKYKRLGGGSRGMLGVEATNAAHEGQMVAIAVVTAPMGVADGVTAIQGIRAFASVGKTGAMVIREVETVGQAVKNETGLIKYEPWPQAPSSPHVDGFLFGARQTETSKTGQIFSRVGSLEGSYVAPQGSSLGARGLPSTYPNTSESLWQVVKPFEMEGGLAAPWMDAPGMGIQYKLPQSIKDLEQGGFIRPFIGQ